MVPAANSEIGGAMGPRELAGQGRRALAAAFAIALLAAGAALASPQIKGASYSGSLVSPRTGYKVSFRVSASGRKVTRLRISNLPFFCPGGGAPIPVDFAAATISKGRFESKGTYVILEGPLKGQVGTKLTITGKFAKGGAEHGTVSVKYPKTAACNGSATYSTTG
jgi:hypothetical protein